MSLLTLMFALVIGATSCKMVSDADIQKAAEELLAENPDLTNVVVEVADQVATLTGSVDNEALKALADNILVAVEGVKSVDNQLEVIPPKPDFSELDAAINEALADIAKEFAGVTAAVEDGVITLEGELKEAKLTDLIEKLNLLNPEEIVNNLTMK